MAIRVCFLLAAVGAATIDSGNAGQAEDGQFLLGGLRTSGGRAVVVLKVPLPQGSLSRDDYQQVCASANAKPVCQGGPSCAHYGRRHCADLLIEADYCRSPMMGLAKRLGFKDPGNRFFSNICVDPGPGWNYEDGTCGGPNFYNHANFVAGQRYTLCAADDVSADISERTEKDDKKLAKMQEKDDKKLDKMQEKACLTTGSDGVGARQPCIFPFKYQGTNYNTCAAIDHTTDWCYTQVDGNGKGIAGQWGNCGSACPKACLTTGSDGVGAGQPCMFPFEYQGTSYSTCTAMDHTTDWCYTQVDGTMRRIGATGQWGNCGSACPKELKNAGAFPPGSAPPDARAAAAAAAVAAASNDPKKAQSDSRKIQRLQQQIEDSAAAYREGEVAVESAEVQHLKQALAEERRKEDVLQRDVEKAELQRQNYQHRADFWSRFIRDTLVFIIFIGLLICTSKCCASEAAVSEAGSQAGKKRLLVEPLLAGDLVDNCQVQPAIIPFSQSFQPRFSIVGYKDVQGQLLKCIRVELPGRELFTGRRTVRGSVQELGSAVRLTVTKEPDFPKHSGCNLQLSKGPSELSGTWEHTLALGEGHWAVVGPEGPSSSSLGHLGDFDCHGVWEVHLAQVRTGTHQSCCEEPGRTFSVCPHHHIAMMDHPEPSGGSPLAQCDDYSVVPCVDLREDVQFDTLAMAPMLTADADGQNEPTGAARTDKVQCLVHHTGEKWQVRPVQVPKQHTADAEGDELFTDDGTKDEVPNLDMASEYSALSWQAESAFNSEQQAFAAEVRTRDAGDADVPSEQANDGDRADTASDHSAASWQMEAASAPEQLEYPLMAASQSAENGCGEECRGADWELLPQDGQGAVIAQVMDATVL